MGFSVEHECPQCGAPISLEETDRLFRCSFCGVQSFLSPSGLFRLVVLPRVKSGPTLFVPYLRFRGSVFTCRSLGIDHRFVDFTQLDARLEGLPASLGVRAQAVRMRFPDSTVAGTFLRGSGKQGETLERVSRTAAGAESGPFLHQAFIGETVSIIYWPFVLSRETLLDGLTESPVARLPGGGEVPAGSSEAAAGGHIRNLAALCPRCGWSLEGGRNSVALACSNCGTVWEAAGESFTPVSFGVCRSQREEVVYLPFWAVETIMEGVDIRSRAEFVRVTGQPVVVPKQWEEEPLRLWTPAFKIRPKAFLTLSRQLTCAPRPFEEDEALPAGRIHPVTLAGEEAEQGLKVVLANATIAKKTLFPRLPEIRTTVVRRTLVFLPFVETGLELVLEGTLLAINKKALAFGRLL